jgi:hypothetical protein
MDIIYIGMVIAFFLLTWGLMRLCDVLGEQKKGDNS